MCKLGISLMHTDTELPVESSFAVTQIFGAPFLICIPADPHTLMVMFFMLTRLPTKAKMAHRGISQQEKLFGFQILHTRASAGNYVTATLRPQQRRGCLAESPDGEMWYCLPKLRSPLQPLQHFQKATGTSSVRNSPHDMPDVRPQPDTVEVILHVSVNTAACQGLIKSILSAMDVSGQNCFTTK